MEGHRLQSQTTPQPSPACGGGRGPTAPASPAYKQTHEKEPTPSLPLLPTWAPPLFPPRGGLPLERQTPSPDHARQTGHSSDGEPQPRERAGARAVYLGSPVPSPPHPGPSPSPWELRPDPWAVPWHWTSSSKTTLGGPPQSTGASHPLSSAFKQMDYANVG